MLVFVEKLIGGHCNVVSAYRCSLTRLGRVNISICIELEWMRRVCLSASTRHLILAFVGKSKDCNVVCAYRCLLRCALAFAWKFSTVLFLRAK